MIQQLDESVGFPNREFGDVYHNPSNPQDAMTFQDFKAYPDGQSSWPDAVKRDKDWKKLWHWMQQIGTVKELNKPNASMLGVLVVHMLDPVLNQHWFFAKWVKDLTVIKGKFTGIPAGAINDTHPGLVYKKGASESYKLKPTDLMSSAGPFGPKDVMSAVKNIPATAAPADLIQQLQFAVNHVAARKPWPISIPNGAQYIAFHSKYTNEWLAPMTLSAGMIPGPDRLMLEKNLMAGKSMVNADIYYSSSVSETLSDSSIDKDGFKIYISSKQQGGGAAASLQGIYDVLTSKKKEFGTGFFKNAKVARFVRIVTDIVARGSLDGMLHAAAEMGVITQEEIVYLESKQMKKVSAKTKKLASSFNARTDNPNYDPYYHLIAAIATATCAKLNAEDYTDVFKAIINKASLVQCYMQTKIRNKTDLDILGMQVVWPPVFSGKVIFTAQKTFTSSEVRGRLGFKIG
jgi:hypothetical protein